MKIRPADYYKEQFESWISPQDARLILSALDDAALKSDRVCQQEFPHSYENAHWAKGSIRKQYIDDTLRGTMFNGDIYGQPREYSGRLLADEKGDNNFTLLKSQKRVAIVWHARSQKMLPSTSALMKYFATLPENIQGALPFPGYLHEKHLPTELDAFFVIRYQLDRDDSSGSKVGKVDVVVPSDDCQNIYCYPCVDLYAYATPVIEDADMLEVELREQEEDLLKEKMQTESESPVNENPSDDTDEGLDIKILPDDEE